MQGVSIKKKVGFKKNLPTKCVIHINMALKQLITFLIEKHSIQPYILSKKYWRKSFFLFYLNLKSYGRNKKANNGNVFD